MEDNNQVEMEMEMETMINHFSHEEHSLTLLNLLPTHNEKGDDHTAVIILCYGCQQQISEAEAYSCLPCGFFLHKRCAQLPREITHPMHSHHPLVLYKQPPYYAGSCVCNACGGDWKFFTYHCSSCEFDLDVSCATLDRSFEHKSCHEHPLISLTRPASFFCNACCIKDEDSSYACSVCPFWIHKKCALLPTSFVAFQCNACPFYICRSCAVEKEIPPDGPHFSYIIHSNQDEVDDGAETRG